MTDRIVAYLLAMIFTGMFVPAIPAQNSVMLSYYESAHHAFSQQKWSEAEKFYKLAAKEGERLGLNNWGMAETLHNVAASLGNQDKYKEALPFSLRSVEMYRKTVTGYTEGNIQAGGMLGRCYLKLQQYKQAIPFLEWTVSAIDESGLLKNNLTGVLYDLGVCQFRTENWKGAEETLRRGRILHAKNGNDEGEADCYRMLGRVAAAKKEYEDAASLYQSAIDRYQKVAKADKAILPILIGAYEDLSELGNGRMKPAESEKAYEAMDAFLAGQGPSGRKLLAEALIHRTQTLNNQAQLKLAEASARKAVEQYDQLGEESDALARAQALLGQILARRGNATEAVTAFRDAVKSVESLTEPEKADAGIVYKEFGDFEFQRQQFTAALTWFEKGLTAAEKYPGSEKVRLIRSLSDLIPVYGKLKRWDDATTTARRLIKTVEEINGKASVALIGPLQQMAWIEEQQKRIAVAERLLKQALAIRQTHGKPGDPEVFTSVTQLAGLYQRDKRQEKAETLFRTTVSDWEKTLGKESGELAVALSGFAGFLASIGKHDEAESLFQRSLANRERAYGPNHRLVAVSLDELAHFYHELGRQRDAEPRYKRALKIFEDSDGDRSRAVASTLNGLGWVYIRLNQFDIGIPLAERALAIKEERGSRPSEVAQGYNTLGVLVKSVNRFKEAEPMLRKALKLYEQDDDKDRLGTAIVMHNLAILLSQTDRVSESETMHRESVSIEEKAGIETAEEITARLNRAGNLARGYDVLSGIAERHGKKDEALREARKALDLRDRYLGVEHPDVLSSLSRLARFATDRGAYAERDALYARMAKLRTVLHGAADDFALADNDWEAVILHRYHGRLDEVDAAYRRLEERYRKKYDGDPKHLVAIWQARGELMVDRGRFDDAKPLLTKVVNHYEKASANSKSHAHAVLAMADYELARGEFGAADQLEAQAYKILGTSKASREGLFRRSMADQRAGRYAEIRKRCEVNWEDQQKADPKSPGYLTALWYMAWIDLLDNRHDDARKKYGEALALAETFHGSDPFYRYAILLDFHELNLRTGRAKESADSAKNVYESLRTRLGEDHPATFHAAIQFGRILSACGQIAIADQILADVKPLIDKRYSSDHPVQAEVRQAKAEMAKAGGKWELAANHFSDCIRIRDAKYPRDHPETKRIIADYATVLAKGERHEELAAIKERLGSEKAGK